MWFLTDPVSLTNSCPASTSESIVWLEKKYLVHVFVLGCSILRKVSPVCSLVRFCTSMTLDTRKEKHLTYAMHGLPPISAVCLFHRWRGADGSPVIMPTNSNVIYSNNCDRLFRRNHELDMQFFNERHRNRITSESENLEVQMSLRTTQNKPMNVFPLPYYQNLYPHNIE